VRTIRRRDVLPGGTCFRGVRSLGGILVKRDVQAAQTVLLIYPIGQSLVIDF